MHTFTHFPLARPIPHSQMEKDIASADKTAKKEQKLLAKTSAANKAEGIASVDGGSEHGSGGGGEGSQNGGGSAGGDEEDARSGEVKNITAELVKRPPEEVFKQFDTDGSGLIDFDEFRAMLPQLGITISMPKVPCPHQQTNPNHQFIVKMGGTV